MPGEEDECFNGESERFTVLAFGVCALSSCNLFISSSFFAILCLSSESCRLERILETQLMSESANERDSMCNSSFSSKKENSNCISSGGKSYC